MPPYEPGFSAQTPRLRPANHHVSEPHPLKRPERVTSQVSRAASWTLVRRGETAIAMNPDL
jgi:hypothetical protein